MKTPGRKQIWFWCWMLTGIGSPRVLWSKSSWNCHNTFGGPNMWCCVPAMFWQLERPSSIDMGKTQTIYSYRNCGPDSLNIVNCLGRFNYSTPDSIYNTRDLPGRLGDNNIIFHHLNVYYCPGCSGRATGSHRWWLYVKWTSQSQCLGQRLQ